MDTIDIKGDDEILALLEKVSPGELDTLVDHITGYGGGRTLLPASIKELLLESRQRGLYTSTTLRIMLSELQHFGGNTIANLARRSGVPYGTIVRDVVEHLGGKADTSASVEHLERTAVSARLGQVWPELDDVARSDYVTLLPDGITGDKLAALQLVVLADASAAAHVAQGLGRIPYSPNHFSSAAKKSLASGMLGFGGPAKLLPAALLPAANDAASTAFRITVPCVMHIHYLRHHAAGLASPSPDPSMPRSQRSALQPISRTLPAHGDAEVVVRGHDGGAVLSASILSNFIATDSAIALPTDRIDRLSPLAQALPSLAVGAETASSRYLRVVVNGPLSPAADGNGLRGFVRGPDGKFTEHARFFEDDRLKNMVSGAALFQVASIVVAQKHLADISRKLDDIKEGVSRIQAFQTNERKAGINGTMQYLQQVAPVILAGQLPTAIRDELEASERQLGMIQDHIHTDLRTLGDAIATLRDPDTFGSKGLTALLQKKQAEFEDLVQQWNFCLAARFVACRLVCSYPDEQVLVERRRDVLQSLARMASDPAEVFHRVPKEIAARAAKITAITDTQTEILANQERLRLWELDTLPVIEQQGRATFEHLEVLLQDNTEPVALVLELKGDRIVRALAA